MIYLILKIFIYLLAALLLGFGAGWLTRNVVSVRREDELQKVVTDARARVPQFESLMRTRDEQVQRLRDEVVERDQKIRELSETTRAKEDELRSKTRELGRLTARDQNLLDADSGSAANADGQNADGQEGALVGGDVLDFSTGSNAQQEAELREQIQRLEQELAEARAETADALAEATAAEAELGELRATRAPDARQGSAQEEVRGKEIHELEARLRQQAEDREQLTRTLQREQRKVTELERERELQNKSLQVLHQQLEVERERNQRAAAG